MSNHNISLGSQKNRLRETSYALVWKKEKKIFFLSSGLINALFYITFRCLTKRKRLEININVFYGMNAM